jgi:hypothetical protein
MQMGSANKNFPEADVFLPVLLLIFSAVKLLTEDGYTLKQSEVVASQMVI